VRDCLGWRFDICLDVFELEVLFDIVELFEKPNLEMDSRH
jgi:hypothetical protein